MISEYNKEYMDLDSQKIRFANEGSNASTSTGYSTSSPQGGAVSGFSMPPSPASSPATQALQTEFSNMNLPAANNTSPQYGNYGSNSTNNTLRNAGYPSGGFITYAADVNMAAVGSGNTAPLGAFYDQMPTGVKVKQEYPAELVVVEQPVEKFRFRYKSEMHGTHGSLNGANSKRTPKTFPEVELKNFNGKAVIRCSLFQTNLDSPHSHQLVVRKDDIDICDPHDLRVSPKLGYIAQFQNMGIIHTAKKYILEELLKKKKDRLLFELERDDLTTKERMELQKETEKEAKQMNLNSVRLCFEAYKDEGNNVWTRIAKPVYTNAINNRKSAQTGELRICRISIAAGSVKGGEDLILLVEKVSKKNIKVRFYELNEDDEEVWEAHANFREADVHHQYAITCQTPAYRDKSIDEPVYVYIELMRPSDDERSAPVKFRYKPLDAVVSRKRRRTCSTATSSSGSAASSMELPRTVLEQNAQYAMVNPHLKALSSAQQQQLMDRKMTISEEFNKEGEITKLLFTESYNDVISANTEELAKMCDTNFPDFAMTELDNGPLGTDGVRFTDDKGSSNSSISKKFKAIPSMSVTPNNAAGGSGGVPPPQAYVHIMRIFEKIRNAKVVSPSDLKLAQDKITALYVEEAEHNDHGDSMLHEMIAFNRHRTAKPLCQVLLNLKLVALFNQILNNRNQSCLHYACLFNQIHYIRPLLKWGCDPKIQDNRGNTALHIAVEQNPQCCEAFLVCKDIDLGLSLRNDEGLTALHLAIRLKNYELACKLLQRDSLAALDANTKDGNNALHMAVQDNNLLLVKTIIDGFGSDAVRILATTTSSGHTPLDLAKAQGLCGRDIVEYLSKYCSNMPLNLVIKEESSSSTEDFEHEDDDDEDSQQLVIATSSCTSPHTTTEHATQRSVFHQQVDMQRKFKTSEVIIKDENDVDDEAYTDYIQNDDDDADDASADAGGNIKNIALILNDEHKLQALANLLEAEKKWQEVAGKLKIGHLMCAFPNAKSMLTYLKNNCDSIDYHHFAKTLTNVEPKTLKYLNCI